MSILVITAIASLLIAGFFLAALIWSIKDGQYEDDYAPPNRILFDENNTKTNNQSTWS
ncbi:cbb3-type cytochrome oxidase assembly protein CcoS [Niabella sp. W65]|nr:cbb3-type cytochrome oxidase assembly protein CcoS [Niabella sp. W65]MCH7367077.1 cbb3-type cytochrome oxidase assembly protein CcoS [Niabella sp. W65]ULT42755.1 cbb3-type cytochrome oxidase assembly protein CcoS [Niabella sp. I65]